MSGKISIGELRQNPTSMLRRVKAGERYVITDRGVPIADVTAHRTQRWVPSAEVNAVLADLRVDSEWAEDIADLRSDEPPQDPWDEGE